MTEDKTVTIHIESSLYNLIEKRAKKSLMDPSDLIEDILRRSMLSYKKKSLPEDKSDDVLVGLFSRKSKKKVKSKPKEKSLYEPLFSNS